MHRIIVDEKKWISEPRFLHALNFCMLLPGPEAQQLATYLGWLFHGVRGGLIAGWLFVAPGALAMGMLSAIYVVWGREGWIGALFFGLKGAVLAIVAEAVLRLARRAVKSTYARVIAAAAFLALFVFNLPYPLVVACAGLAGYFGPRAPQPPSEPTAALAEEPSLPRTIRVAAFWASLWLTPTLALLVIMPNDILTAISVFFVKAAVVTFGGAYSVLAYVAQRAVEERHWLSPGEMLDGLGLAETTPGPLIIVLQFVGFLAASRGSGGAPSLMLGFAGAALTTWATFAPSFLWIFVGAPYVERLRGRPGLSAALAGVAAAVVGIILNLAVWFAIHTLFTRQIGVEVGALALRMPDPASFDWKAAAIALASFVALFGLRIGMFATLGAAALLGSALYAIGL